MLRSEWTDAWESPDTPDPLPMPMQYRVSGDCVARSHRYADKAGPVMFHSAGQVVGQLDGVENDRKSVVAGKRGSVRVDLGGSRNITNTHKDTHTTPKRNRTIG